MSYAAYRALVDLFPPARVPDTRARTHRRTCCCDLDYDPANESRDLTTPAGVGNAAADAVIAYRHADGSNQLGNYANTPATTATRPRTRGTRSTTSGAGSRCAC